MIINPYVWAWNLSLRPFTRAVDESAPESWETPHYFSKSQDQIEKERIHNMKKDLQELRDILIGEEKVIKHLGGKRREIKLLANLLKVLITWAEKMKETPRISEPLSQARDTLRALVETVAVPFKGQPSNESFGTMRDEVHQYLEQTIREIDYWFKLLESIEKYNESRAAEGPMRSSRLE